MIHAAGCGRETGREPPGPFKFQLEVPDSSRPDSELGPLAGKPVSRVRGFPETFPIRPRRGAVIGVPGGGGGGALLVWAAARV